MGDLLNTLFKRASGTTGLALELEKSLDMMRRSDAEPCTTEWVQKNLAKAAVVVWETRIVVAGTQPADCQADSRDKQAGRAAERAGRLGV
ncbi:hypothetical protein BpHYR1_005986 [Brachionus plicatilis]|uniref:Uncharacterized protein n=1 Tax=Brachionus plicatilis TaxID=10195 RepID=A0A3M7SWN1_BRAPC|nr:hypothetical protein BpHYR1_005986 [Brachionus plicatilis]